MKELLKCSAYAIAGIAIAEKRFLEPEPAEEKPPELESIFEDVCTVFSIPAEAMKGRSRKTPLVNARKIYTYVSRLKAGATCTAIADYIDRDHTSILYYLSEVKGYLQVNDHTFMPYWRKYVRNSQLFERKDLNDSGQVND